MNLKNILLLTLITHASIATTFAMDSNEDDIEEFSKKLEELHLNNNQEKIKLSKEAYKQIQEYCAKELEQRSNIKTTPPTTKQKNKTKSYEQKSSPQNKPNPKKSAPTMRNNASNKKESPLSSTSKKTTNIPKIKKKSHPSKQDKQLYEQLKEEKERKE